jgi:hypothetical protein
MGQFVTILREGGMGKTLVRAGLLLAAAALLVWFFLLMVSYGT